MPSIDDGHARQEINTLTCCPLPLTGPAMPDDRNDAPFDPALGAIEPQAGLLTAPPEGQRLYKITTVENLLRSASGRYLHFNRVDSLATRISRMATSTTASNCSRIARPTRRLDSKKLPTFRARTTTTDPGTGLMRAASRWRTPVTYTVSHCREIVVFRQARNLGKRHNTVHSIDCAVRPSSGSAAQVARTIWSQRARAILIRLDDNNADRSVSPARSHQCKMG